MRTVNLPLIAVSPRQVTSSQQFLEMRAAYLSAHGIERLYMLTHTLSLSAVQVCIAAGLIEPQEEIDADPVDFYEIAILATILKIKELIIVSSCDSIESVGVWDELIAKIRFEDNSHICLEGDVITLKNSLSLVLFNMVIELLKLCLPYYPIPQCRQRVELLMEQEKLIITRTNDTLPQNLAFEHIITDVDILQWAPMVGTPRSRGTNDSPF